MKLIVLFGIYGGMTLEELTYLLWSDIDESQEGMVKITIQVSKTDRIGRSPFSFFIPRITTFSGINACGLLAKYKAQINFSDCSGRVWRTYRNCQFIKFHIHINSISQIGQKVAYFLGLNNPEAYTSHSFRRTGSTLLANEGISLFNLKRFGRWKSDSVAQRYVETSERSKQ
jgi:integrase